MFMRSGITPFALERGPIRPEGREGNRHQAIGPVISVRGSGCVESLLTWWCKHGQSGHPRAVEEGDLAEGTEV